MALTALSALINFSVASLLLGLLRWACLPCASWLANKRAVVFPSPGSGLLALGVMLSPMVGLVGSRVFKKQVLGGLRWLSGTGRDLEFTDVFHKTANELLGQQVIISLTSGKVYVGILLQASGDPNEPERSIVIQPVMSGFRDEKHLVTFNTDYFQADNLPDVRLLLPMRNVQGIANFDQGIHATFVQRGVTKVEPADRNEPRGEHLESQIEAPSHTAPPANGGERG